MLPKVRDSRFANPHVFPTWPTEPPVLAGAVATKHKGLLQTNAKSCALHGQESPNEPICTDFVVSTSNFKHMFLCEGGAVNRKPFFSAKMGLTDSHVFYMCE